MRFNRAAADITGYAKEDIQGKNWFEIIVPRDRYPDLWSEFERITSGNNRAEEFENPILTKSGEERHIAWRNNKIKAGGQVIGTMSFGIDVTETKKVQARLANSEGALVEAQCIAHIGNWAYDLTSRELTWSGEVFRILGLDPEQSKPSIQAFLQTVHPDDRVRVKAAYKQFLESHRPYELNYQLLLQVGNTQYVSQQSRAIFDNAGNPLRFVGTLQDVTLQTIQEIGMQECEERFRTIANYTYGWEYREGTQQEILYINPACERVSGYSALQFITNPGLLAEIVHPDDRVLWVAHRHDIIGKSDGEVVFRIITKDGQVRWIAHGSLGHEAGDLLLVEVAKHLSNCIRHGDTVARTGGDEFIIVLPEIAHPTDATTVAEKILGVLQVPIQLGGQRAEMSTSIGIALHPVNGTDEALDLMKKADHAMYAAKQAGRNRYMQFGDQPGLQ